MREQLAQYKIKIMEVGNKLSLFQKVAVTAVLLATIGLFAYLITNATAVKYSGLISNLSAEDSSQIVEFLKKEKVPYQLASGGSAIKVPDEKVLDIRLMLAGSGLPKGGGVGYEIFDNQDITTLTDFTEHVNMIRATQGELARTIQHLEPVKSARVHIVMPKESMFVEDQKKPTASILLDLHAGRALSQKQVSSIVHLVASSIEGMNPDDVTIVDSTGNVLNSNEGVGEGITGKNLEYRKKIEKNLEENILKLISPIVGEGKARVTVNADIDFDRAEKNEELYNPNVTAIRSETKVEESKENVKGPATGVTGTQANLPGGTGQAVSENGNAAKSSLEKSTTNYEINKTIRKVIESVGNIKKVSVSVVLDGMAKKNGEKIEMVPLADAQVKSIDEIVRTSVGYDEKRGDKVVVTSIPFAEKELETPVPVSKEILTYALKYNLIPWLVLLLIFMVGVIPLYRSIKSVAVSSRMATTPEGMMIDGVSMPSQTSGMEGMEGLFGGPEKHEKTQEEIELEKLSIEIEKSMGITMSKEQLVAISFARKNTDLTSKILKKWMKDK